MKFKKPKDLTRRQALMIVANNKLPIYTDKNSITKIDTNHLKSVATTYIVLSEYVENDID